MAERIYTSSGYVEGTTTHHYGVTLDHNEPTTGVMIAHHSMALLDSTYDGIDLAQEEHEAECDICQGIEEGSICDWADAGYERGTVLAGDWKKDEGGLWDPDKDGTKGYSAIVGETYAQIVWSKYTTRARLCSPCFPGQCDLDAIDPNGQLCYILPPDMLEEEK